MAATSPTHGGPKLTRRDLLRQMGFAAITFWLPARWALALSPRSDPEASEKTLRALVDTLLPGNGAFPSASALGVDRSILSAAESNTGLAKLISAGCRWLDQAAHSTGEGAFFELAAPVRASIIAAAERSAGRSLPRVLFSSTRDLAFRYYYASPESWRPLSYAGPPQPSGFAGHDRAPGESA